MLATATSNRENMEEDIQRCKSAMFSRRDSTDGNGPTGASSNRSPVDDEAVSTDLSRQSLPDRDGLANMGRSQSLNFHLRHRISCLDNSVKSNPAERPDVRGPDAPEPLPNVAPPQPLVKLGKRPFGHRHPVIAKFLSLLATAFLSLSLVIPLGLFVIPVVTVFALCSRVFGKGELAQKILAGRFVKLFCGDALDGMSNEGLLALLLIPVLGPLLVSFDGVMGISSAIDRKLLGEKSEDELTMLRKFENAGPLNRAVALWRNHLPEHEKGRIRMDVWAKIVADKGHDAWSVPLSASLWEWSGCKPGDKKRDVPEELASRMAKMLVVIQDDPAPYIEFISSLGLSGMASCRDLPVLNFLDLELRTQAQQTLVDIQKGKKALPAMFDIAVRRLVFELTQKSTMLAVNAVVDEIARSTKADLHAAGLPERMDGVSVTLTLWDRICKDHLLAIPQLPYRTYASEVQGWRFDEMVKGIVDNVKDQIKDKAKLMEVLRENNAVPWRAVQGDVSKGVESQLRALDEETQARLKELNAARESEEEPPQPEGMTVDEYYGSPAYLAYLQKQEAFVRQGQEVESAAAERRAAIGGVQIRFDETEGTWSISV